MTVTDTVFWQQIIAIWIWFLAMLGCVARVPVEHQMRRLNFAKKLCCLRAGSRVACHFIFQHENNVLLACLVRGLKQLIVHRLAIWRGIVESPEIEAADPVGVEGFCHLDASLQGLVLLLESKVGVEFVALGAELRPRCARPVYLEEWTGNVCHPQIVLLQDLL